MIKLAKIHHSILRFGLVIPLSSQRSTHPYLWIAVASESTFLFGGDSSFYARHVILLFLIFPSCLLPPPSLSLAATGRPLPLPSSLSSHYPPGRSVGLLAIPQKEAAAFIQDRKSNPKAASQSHTHSPIHPRTRGETALSLPPSLGCHLNRGGREEKEEEDNNRMQCAFGKMER